MIPTTIFEVIDNSKSTEVKKASTIKPLFLTVISSDKGDEDLRLVEGDEFYSRYGKKSTISYARHGQPLIQAANIIDNGGRLLVKRVVADDSTLANIAVIANLSKTTVQKKNSAGDLLYLTAGGTETTLADGNTAIMIDVCSIKFECRSVTGTKNIQSAASVINSLCNDTQVNGGVYPLFIISDNGRGVSNKKFRISPLYDDSKYLKYVKYLLEVIENDEIIETAIFTIDPEVVESGNNKSIQNVVSNSAQIKAISFDDNYKLFVNKVAAISANTSEYCNSSDLIFGKERTLTDLTNIDIDSTGFNLSYIYGIALDNGGDGSFTSAPFGLPEWEAKVVEVFDGSYTDDIYDVDKYKIDAVVDANYPPNVKRAIENLVAFREDLSYFRDLGLGLNTLEDILAVAANDFKNKYCFTYGVSYDIIDPCTRKQIPVTIGYSIARLLSSHFTAGRVRPFAGQLYGITIPEAIHGTVNYIPKVTPSENQKQILSDNRINYVSYYDDILTVETLYTSQDDFTQLSFINNILAVQEVVKAVRTKCPKIRYSFIDGDDLETYRRDVQVVLDKYISNFKSLKMVYTPDSTMLSNKIFYASIEVSFKDFVQTEYFKLFAI